MTKNELIKIADSLGIKHYNECEEFICLEGINGGGSVLFTDNKHKCHTTSKPATMESFATHLKQMGRDSLKMDLDRLLNITRHA